MTNLDSILKSRDITLLTELRTVKATVFPVSMWDLGNKKGWESKNWCFWAVVLEKTLESPLNCQEIKPVHPKGNQPWIFIGRTDAEAEILPVPPDLKSRLIGKDPDARKDWRQEAKGTIENKMVGWHHWFNGHELQQIENSEGQGSLMHCSPRGHKELDTAAIEQQQHWDTSLRVGVLKWMFLKRRFSNHYFVLVAQSCPILCNPVECSLPGSSVPWNSPGKNTRVGTHFFLQEIFPTQGLNTGLLHCRPILHHLSHRGSPLL